VAEAVNVVVLDIPGDILAALKELKLTQRIAFDLAVERFLDKLVQELTTLRLTAPKFSNRRPRKVSQATWEALGDAAEKLDVSRPALLRACLLQLLAQSRKAKK
jgi:hypothetical protein